MNQEQAKSALRWGVATFGGVIAGFFGATGFLSTDLIMSVLNSETFLGLGASVAVGAWGLFTHTQANAVAVVNAMPEVAGVITVPTPEGMDLAIAVSQPTVIPAGTERAARVAKSPFSHGGHT